MQSLKLTIAYDGTEYCGWQVQPNGVTIQALIETAFEKVTGVRTPVTASGRTDSGVHALGQVASCETQSDLLPDRLCLALNAHLPDDIRVRDVQTAATGFHAIRDAKGKRYRYCIQNGGIPDFVQRRFTWFWPTKLDVESMQKAADLLTGEHDFAAFQATGSPRASTVRTISHFEVDVLDAEMSEQIVIEVEANGFLYNMVRNLVGTLVEIGRGAHSIEWVSEVLESKDRRRAGRTAPPEGLFLLYVNY